MNNLKSQPKKIVALIKKKAFSEKMSDLQTYGFFFEYRAVTNFWRARLRGIEYPAVLILNVGQGSHRFTATSCEIITGFDIPLKYRQFLPDLKDDDGIYRITVKPFRGISLVSPPEHLTDFLNLHSSS